MKPDFRTHLFSVIDSVIRDYKSHQAYSSKNLETMKVILDIQDDRVPFFMELLKSLDYINILKEVKSREKSNAIQDLAEAFNDVKLYENGKKKLKSAKDLLDEL